MTFENRSQEMFCKSDFGKLVAEIEPKSEHFYYFDEEKMMYYVDEQTRSIEINDYLSAGMLSLEMEGCQLMYGQPNSILVLEDLILEFSLADLQDMFYHTVNRLRHDQPD